MYFVPSVWIYQDMSLGNYFSVPLFYDQSNDTVPETITTVKCISDYKIKYEAIDIKMIFFNCFAVKSHNISLERFCTWPCIESENFCNSKLAYCTRLTEFEKQNFHLCLFLLKFICISLWWVCYKIILYNWQMYWTSMICSLSPVKGTQSADALAH